MKSRPITPRVLSLATAAAFAVALMITPAAMPFSTVLIPVGIGGVPRRRSGVRSRPAGATRRRRSRRYARQRAALQGADVGRGIWSQLPRRLGRRQRRRDIRAHVQSMAQAARTPASCSAATPWAPRRLISWPGRKTAACASQHIAAVALFGNGAKRLGPAPAYAGRTIDQCADGDPICGRGVNWPSHLQPSYIGSGLVDQAASFIAGRL